MDKIEKIYKKDISNLLKGVENSNVPVVNPIIADVLDKMNIDTNAKLATLSIDASMRFLNRIGASNVSNQDILIGDLVSAYFYKCATLNKDLVFLDIMTQAISKQNELKQTLAHDKINQDTAIIKEIESIFITTVIDYYKINMDKENLKDQIYAYYY